MTRTVDLCMWAKNGERTLPFVLERINSVIPREMIHQKIMIDDHSTDNTPAIGKKFGWNVIPNEGHGIGHAANLALKKVKTDVFCSFEQDLLLAPNWFEGVYPLIFKENTVVASGLRFLSAPRAARDLEIYIYNDLCSNYSKGLIDTRHFPRTIDNTIYRTAFLTNMGGFDFLRSGGGQDSRLSQKILRTAYSWKVNYNVISVHLRPNSYLNELRHQKWYATTMSEILQPFNIEPPIGSTFFRLVKSPLTSIKIVKRTKNPSLTIYYPTLLVIQLIGFLQGKKFANPV
ncbi:MAG: glycosyltransferase family 2 protein [Candidatus Bathyarchaeota archaeon]|nr:glycosyltransferase family 2 protein [Candidatus Bathyarchaeota archaeon]